MTGTHAYVRVRALWAFFRTSRGFAALFGVVRALRAEEITSPPNARPFPFPFPSKRPPLALQTRSSTPPPLSSDRSRFFARTLERDPGRGQKSTTAWRASRRRRLARHLGLHQAGRARALPTLTRRRLRPPAHHLALRSQPLRLGATSLSVLRVERKSAPCFTYVPCVQCQLWKLHRSMFHLRTYPT